MGSDTLEGQLWGMRSTDWATIQEKTSDPCYAYALRFLSLAPGDSLLDIGCGSGQFCIQAYLTKARITGLDASEPLIEEARKREPTVPFLVGDMDDLPFASNMFDFVTGFNSFQYAADATEALKEAIRVLKRRGLLATLVWGNREDCQASSYFSALSSLLPPTLNDAPGPFHLSDKHVLEHTLEDLGQTIIDNADIPVTWEYENTDIALRGLLSAGPVSKAIEYSGLEKVKEVIATAIEPYINPLGQVVYENIFRMVISKKEGA